MKIDVIRIYAEVLEQGIDFKEYFQSIGIDCPIINIYTKKVHGEIVSSDSLVSRIRKSKDVDVLITAICNDQEIPLLMVEYSTAVPTDDHKMQRSDVYYWGAVYKTPIMKIYPLSKGMAQDFGGGDKITDADEIVLAKHHGAIFYPILWHTIPHSDVLDTKRNALSCIANNTEIKTVLSQLLKCFNDNSTIDSFYNSLLLNYDQQYSHILAQRNTNNIKSLISNSTRFHWDNDNLTVKINRFGHAMDPDRGVLFFVNMLVGADHTVTEIQVNRDSDFNARGGYSSLFDALSRKNELSSYVKNLIHTQKNTFSDENALHIFVTALNLPTSLFTKVSNAKYAIADAKLYDFLIKHPSISIKSIFFLSTKLILTDQYRRTICSITWNTAPIKQYLNTLYEANYTPLEISSLSHSAAKEDIVTYASVELYKKMQCDLLAVSYPGAQGDRCILSGGAGRKVLRTYIDIIAYQENAGITTVYLEECKDEISKSVADAHKLNALIEDVEKLKGLSSLYKKTVGHETPLSLNIGIGAKHSSISPAMNVDYIFMFCIDDSCAEKTVINYNVAIINTKLVKDFEALANSNGKLIGSFELDKIYVIK
jgi:hypothetical protein